MSTSKARQVYSRTIWCLKLAVTALEQGEPQVALINIGKALGALKFGKR
jgi:hypothetical protein